MITGTEGRMGIAKVAKKPRPKPRREYHITMVGNHFYVWARSVNTGNTPSDRTFLNDMKRMIAQLEAGEVS